MHWRNQRDLILQWWPVYLTGQPKGYVFLEGLEQNLWSCQHERDFEAVMHHIQTIWGEPLEAFQQLSYFMGHTLKSPPPLYSHFGASLGGFLQQRMLQEDTGELSWVKPQKIFVQDDNVLLAQKLQDQFGLASVNCSQSVDPMWLKRQLTDCHIGLTTLSELFNLPKEAIGRGKLGLWFHQHAPFRKTILAHDQMDILLGGGDVIKAWCQWVFSDLLQTGAKFDLLDASSIWRQSWGKGVRHHIERKQHFLQMSQGRFKQLMDTLDVTTDLSQKALRRFKAYKKWSDELEKGSSVETILQSWHKVRTGNKIAWSAEREHPHFVQAWKKIEKSVEKAFFTQSNWDIPAWVQTSLPSQEWQVQDERQDVALWSIGFEALVREQMGFDSWLASSKSTHPIHSEAEEFFVFFHQHLARYLF